MSDVASALYSGRIAAPGTPKTTSTPSDSITRTTASITFIFGMAGSAFLLGVQAGAPAGAAGGGRGGAPVWGGRGGGGRAPRPLRGGPPGDWVAVAATVRAQRLEHLVDGRRARQRDPVLPRGGERDAQVLVVQVDPEAGREVVLEEVAPADLHDLVGREATGQHLDDRRRIDAGL